ncbi:hypothetical protein FGO68_gene4637 [Halteria grandinella]|uniref:Uncharacterized protein n=1 Tax=Halteria grandinella TaxID=5974 RepID=A0A8J8T0M6_HALGN|nr:hypothetical protein FGO68_gene4637 [Halteria grandinella]
MCVVIQLINSNIRLIQNTRLYICNFLETRNSFVIANYYLQHCSVLERILFLNLVFCVYQSCYTTAYSTALQIFALDLGVTKLIIFFGITVQLFATYLFIYSFSQNC